MRSNLEQTQHFADSNGGYSLPKKMCCRDCRGTGRFWRMSDRIEYVRCKRCAGTGREPIPFEEVWGI